MSKKHKTAVITSIDDVPPGFVQISQMFPDGTQRAKHWRRILSDAHAEGHIRAVKLFRTVDDAKTGPVFVSFDEAKQFIAEYEARTTAPKAPKADECRQLLDPRIVTMLAENNALLAAILDLLRDQSRRIDQPQWHPSGEDEVEA